MKCNFNGTINNKMAILYGQEFNLSTEEIINTIKKMSKLELIDSTFDPIEVEVVLYNYDYYVRPGGDKVKFIMEVSEVVSEIKLDEGETDDGILHRYLAIRLLDIIKRFFDESYFEEQIAHRATSITSATSKNKLRMYLNRLDKEQLKIFLNTVVVYKHQYGLFMSSVSSVLFWERIHNACRKNGINVPTDFSSLEGQAFLRNNDSYYFRVLNTKTIAAMLCDAIDLNIEIASSAAKKLCKSGYGAMLNYINREVNSCTVA